MIGGTDVVFGAVGSSASLEACARIVRRSWPQVRFEDAVTGDKYERLADVPFGSVIARKNDITVVLDNPDTADMRLIIEGIRGLPTDNGDELEQYSSDSINDAILLRHFGITTLNGRPLFDGFFPSDEA